MKDYYYVSEGIIKQFPEFEKSKAFNGPFDIKCFIAVIPDFNKLEKFVKEDQTDAFLFAYQCVDSQVDLTYDAVDYDDDDNELEVTRTLNVEVCKDWGLITAIEMELGLTKEENVAYAIFKLSEQNNVTPIELIDLVYPFVITTIEKAEKLKGKKLNAQEKMIIEMFGCDKNYFISLDHRGYISAHLIKK